MMRNLLASALAGMCALQGAAIAADLDYGVLRGADYEPAAVRVIDWNGVYAGGHGGWSTTAHGFGSSLKPLVAQEYSGLEVEQQFSVSSFLRPDAVRTNGVSFGGFVGYNVMVDDFVFGIEADYTHTGQTAVSTDSIGRAVTTSSGNFNVVDLSGSSKAKLVDYGTVRGRVGYVLGDLLPFVTAGLAFGHAKTAESISSQNYGYNTAALNTFLGGTNVDVYNFGYRVFDPAHGVYTPASAVSRSRSSQKFVGGFAGGFGLDYALTSNIFLRGEYQYIEFNEFNGHKANVNTVRAAAAVKF